MKVLERIAGQLKIVWFLYSRQPKAGQNRFKFQGENLTIEMLIKKGRAISDPAL